MGMSQLGINQKYSIPEETRTLEAVHKNYTYFSENDILLAKITPCFQNGKLGIAKQLKNRIGFGSSEVIVLRKKSSISNEWLYYFLLRDEFRKHGKPLMTGAVGHKRLPKEYIENTKINFPDLTTQKQIIKKLESIQHKTSKITKILGDKIINLHALKSALLAQAFLGQPTKDIA
jgi:type I restriction enzyme S subunit